MNLRTNFPNEAITRWMASKVFKTIFSMHCLTSLHLRTSGIVLYPSEIGIESFKQNTSVAYLGLSFDCDDIAIFKIILKPFPQVEALKVLNMTDEVANTISDFCKFLKNLSVQYFLVKNVFNEPFFQNLENFTCKIICNGSQQMYNKPSH